MSRNVYQFQLKPTYKQERDLNAMLNDETCLYNLALQKRKEHYEATGKRLTFFDQCKWLTQYKRSSEGAHLKRWSAWSLQRVLNRVDLAYVGFFRRVEENKSLPEGKKNKPGYPRPKGKRGVRSATFECESAPHWNTGRSGLGKLDRSKSRKVKATTVTAFVQGVGHIKVNQHRPVEGTPVIFEIIKRRHKWFISVTSDTTGIEHKTLAKTGKTAGFDLGKRDFLACSDGSFTANQRHLNAALPKLRITQRKLAKARGGTTHKRKNLGEQRSNSAVALSRTVGNLHEKVANQRKDTFYKLAWSLVREYDVLYFENLDIRQIINGEGMFGPHAKRHENRNTHDASWGEFTKIMKCIAAKAGKEVILVDPAYTSQRCNACGHIEKDNRSLDAFECLRCGHLAHAGTNAALNIKLRGEGVAFKGKVNRTVVKPSVKPAESCKSPGPRIAGNPELASA